jgi:LAO/AO transport system kinase
MRIQQHRAFLERSGQLESRRKARLEREIVAIAELKLRQRVLQPRTETAHFQNMLNLVLERRTDPYTAAESILSAERSGSSR